MPIEHAEFKHAYFQMNMIMRKYVSPPGVRPADDEVWQSKLIVQAFLERKYKSTVTTANRKRKS